MSSLPMVSGGGSYEWDLVDSKDRGGEWDVSIDNSKGSIVKAEQYYDNVKRCEALIDLSTANAPVTSSWSSGSDFGTLTLTKVDDSTVHVYSSFIYFTTLTYVYGK